MHTIVIVGAGFSGTATAVQLLRQSPTGLHIVMVNRSEGMARGIAYGTSSPLHRLNVPAGNMSALSDEPEDFVRYCQRFDRSTKASDFVSRKRYGDYLVALLGQAQEECRSGSILTCHAQEAVALRASPGGVEVELADGNLIQADHVVLAFGHFAPQVPRGVDLSGLVERYQQDPWANVETVPVSASEPVLLLGSGLTALDVALTLEKQAPLAPIYLLSRRGLLPLPHRDGGVHSHMSDEWVARLLQGPATIRSYLRELRQQVRQEQERGFNWRDVLVALRPHTSNLWRRLPRVERRRFLRHVQVYWDVHRHRVAPVAFQSFAAALASGRIRTIAGRIKTVERSGDKVRIGIQPRGGLELSHIEVAYLVNCTGPSSDLTRVADPLIQQLRGEGLIDIDPDGLGLRVDEHLCVRDQQGKSLPWLSYIGPMLKAEHWEATAVPELRQYAWQLARRLVSERVTG